MNKQRTPMPQQDPSIRAKNFEEVALGYTDEQAQQEAARCLNCKNPKCVGGCPVSVPIPQFIQAIKEGKIAKAYEIIKSTSSLPAICGRVCPQEEQCEKQCILGIKGEPVAIGNLERYVADWAMKNLPSQASTTSPADKKHKAAIIGAGPAGLTCAGDLAKAGIDVTVFEAFHKPGGVLIYGIPEFRLPKSLVGKEIDALKDLGVKFKFDSIVGRTYSIEELMKEHGFNSVFIGSGAGLPRFMNIDGEDLIGVFSANEYLTRINLMKAYQPDSMTPLLKGDKVVVVGGGNVAMDAARSALRMGSEVHIVYRRSLNELPARKEEVHHAQEEGIIFDTLCNPTEIIGGNGKVTGIKCLKMALGEADASGRRRPIPIDDSEFILDADLVIMAIGTNPNPLIVSTTEGLDSQSWGGIKVNEETMQTNIEGVYSGGDAVTGAATVILAMGAGKKAAKAMINFMHTT